MEIDSVNAFGDDILFDDVYDVALFRSHHALRPRSCKYLYSA